MTLDPTVAGVQVVWQQLGANKKWVDVRRATTNAAGVAVLKWDTGKGRTYTVCALVVGNDKASGATTASPVDQVLVT